jgi:hypothetical protein
MKIQIKYPEAKCKWCGQQFTKHHNRQEYCTKECAEEANKEKNRNRVMKHYYRHRNRINQTKIGTRTIGPHKNPEDEREHQIIKNEKQRLGLMF